MDVERHSASGSSSSSSSKRPQSSVVAARLSNKRADQLVKIELEAAEVLADLAQSLMRKSESNGVESGGKWGTKGKRGRKRFKSEPHPSDTVKNPDNSPPSSLDLAQQQDKIILVQQECRKINRNIILTKAEPDAEVAKHSPVSATDYAPHSGGKSRQNLTEAEKEARRLRRVLANRESARQTIRRRQALCEELTRKSADLLLENEALKREKERAMKEFQSLESANKQLKAQVAKIIKPEVDKIPQLSSTHRMMSIPPSTNCPLLLYNQPPFTPFLWPSIIQSSNPVQSECLVQNGIATRATPDQRELPPNVDAQTPLYILPYPWFFPIPNHRNGVHHQPSCDLKDNEDETSDNNQCSSSSSLKNKAQIEDPPSCVPINVKSEASNALKIRPANNLQDSSFGFLPDAHHIGPHSKGRIPTNTLREASFGFSPNAGHIAPQPRGMILSPTPVTSFKPAVALKHENGLQSCYSDNAESGCSVSVFPEKNQESVICPSKRLVDAVAAAEARKRRKELTKLKNLHGRQFRMHC